MDKIYSSYLLVAIVCFVVKHCFCFVVEHSCFLLLCGMMRI